MKLKTKPITPVIAKELEEIYTLSVAEYNAWVYPHLEKRIESRKGIYWALGGELWAVKETGCSIFAKNHGGLRIMYSGDVEQDGLKWIHLSVSRENRLPSWVDMIRAKDAWLGPESKAIQVFPPKAEYVNISDVLHLWECIDNPHVLPDFRKDNPALAEPSI